MARKEKSRRKTSRRRGPGEYLPEPTEDVTRPEAGIRTRAANVFGDFSVLT